MGAGIAGLTAAYKLLKRGVDVTVLEASDRVGGRMSTDRIDGWVIDRGAQFLSEGYSTIRCLIDDLGLSHQFHTARSCGGIVRDGRVRRIDARAPWSASASGLLGVTGFARLAAGTIGLAISSAVLPLSDYSKWRAFDQQTAADWASSRFGREAFENVFEPMLAGFYFQQPEEMSAALAAQVWGYAARRKYVAALAGGIGTLPEALAQKLAVKLSTPVTAIKDSGLGVEVQTQDETMHCDQVVLAATADVARSLYPAKGDSEQRLLSTRYSSTVNVTYILPRGLPASDLAPDIYGVLIPRSERDVIAGIGVESRKCASYAADGEVLNVMLDGVAGKRLVACSDAQITAEVLPDLDRIFPGVDRATSAVYVHRWQYAEPYSQPGRSRDIHEYRNARNVQRRVILAGDYMGAPTTEGAAESGAWAASRCWR